MSEPIRKSYSRDEAIAFARAYLVEIYGKPKDLSETARDAWHLKFGVICAVFHDMFPVEEQKP